MSSGPLYKNNRSTARNQSNNKIITAKMTKLSNIVRVAAIVLPLLALFAMMSTTTTTTVTTSAIIGGLEQTAVDSFSGDYADPNHPNCLRKVQVLDDGSNKALVSGTDGNPGCPIDGSGTEWKLDAIVNENKISVDFSPKGGPSSLQGVKTTKGILWADNNLWTNKI